MKIFIEEINEWFFTLLSFLPGNIGKLSRRLIYKFLFNESYKINIDRGCKFIACQNMSFSKSVSIGMNSFITSAQCKLIIGDNTVIGMNAHLNADLGDLVKIGSNCIIGPNLLLRASNHNYNDTGILIRNQGHKPEKIIIEDNVWIGANVTILGKTHLKSGTVVAAGSVIFKEYDSNSLIAGNPGKTIKNISNSDK